MSGWCQRLGQTISELRQSVDILDVELAELAERVAKILEWHVDMLGLVVLARIAYPWYSTSAVLPNSHRRKLREITSNIAVIISLTF